MQEYAERLHVPAAWWLVAAVMVGSVWLAYLAALGPGPAALVGGVVGAVVAALLVRHGSLRIAVTPGGLSAGRARLPLWAVGEVTPLDANAARRLRGPEADPRAYLVLRGYVPGAVKVVVDDPDDPVPYWLVSTRHPQRLAAALEQARAAGPR